MIPLSECKKALGPVAKNLTDKEILRIRDILDQLADVLFDHWLWERNKGIQNPEND